MCEEAVTEKKSKMQSDIMIVLLHDGNYYVSEKLHGREPYYKLLSDRSHTSTHYATYEEASEAAKRLRERILDDSPDCEIIEIDIRDYLKNARLKVSAREHFYDENGEMIFGISPKGKKVFEFRADEERYILIDKRLYTERLMEKLGAYAENDACDFDALGRIRAYRLASDCNLPGLHFEVYKARELLKSFEWDRELFACDTVFYTAYAEALEDAIALQKQCALVTRHWIVHLLNLTDHVFHVTPSMRDSDFGPYEIVMHASAENFSVQETPDEIFVIFIKDAKNKTETDETILSLGLRDDQLYIIYGPAVTGRNKIRDVAWTIENLICSKLFELGLGNPVYKISERFIPSLGEYAEEEKGCPK